MIRKETENVMALINSSHSLLKAFLLVLTTFHQWKFGKQSKSMMCKYYWNQEDIWVWAIYLMYLLNSLQPTKCDTLCPAIQKTKKGIYNSHLYSWSLNFHIFSVYFILISILSFHISFSCFQDCPELVFSFSTSKHNKMACPGTFSSTSVLFIRFSCH